MSESNMRVIPMDDYAYLTRTKVSHAKCPICGRKDFNGAMLIYGHDKKQRIILCDNCLKKLDIKGFTTAMNSNNGYISKSFVIERLKKKQKCDCDLSEKRQDGFILRFAGQRVFCCTSCFDDLRHAVHNYNRGYNAMYISEVEREEKKLATQQAEELENYRTHIDEEMLHYKNKLEIEKAAQIDSMRMLVYQTEAKVRAEAKFLVEHLKTPEQIQFFYNFGETDRARFIKQLNTKKQNESIEEIRYPLSREGTKFINSLFLVSAFPYTQCSAYHYKAKRPQAKYYLGSHNKNYSSFEFLLCNDCINNLYDCLYEILSDPALDESNQDNIKISRIIDENRECYSCGVYDETLRINVGNIVFYLCINCAKEFFKKLGNLICKIDKLFHPLIIVEKKYPNYNSREMICKKPRKSVRLFGYSIDKARRTKAKFLVNDKFYPPVECECIGHVAVREANAVITTQREKDNFCLALCKNCASTLKDALAKDNYEMNSGTSILIQQKSWVNNEHCMFCGLSQGKCNRVRIGSVEFSACDNCKEKLLNALKEIH